MAGPDSPPAAADEQSSARVNVPLLDARESQHPSPNGNEYFDSEDEESIRRSSSSNFFELTDVSNDEMRMRAASPSISKLRKPLSLPAILSRKWRNKSSLSTKTKSSPCRLICYSVVGTFMILGIMQFISLSFITLRALFPDQAANFTDHWGDPSKISKDLLHWPTDSSRDIQPVPCHSHNDYWRKVPVHSALHAGCSSIEADVWLVEDDLFVGHSKSSLTPHRTLKTLYINPLLDIITKQNPSIELQHDSASGPNGVFDTDPAQTLVLLIDFKTDGTALWPYVESQLDPLRQKGFLTHFDGDSVVVKPVTVIATGNAPFSLVTANTTYRDIFFDAPLDQMAPSPKDALIESFSYNTTNSYFASASFSQSIGRVWAEPSTSQLEQVRAQIRGAHERGLKVRYWETPAWPRGLRNHIWNVLIKEGVDYLNVDDLEAATQGTWGRWN